MIRGSQRGNLYRAPALFCTRDAAILPEKRREGGTTWSGKCTRITLMHAGSRLTASPGFFGAD
jgi:hypothetical protein